MRRRLRARLRRSLLWFLLAAASGLFFEVLAWVTRTDFHKYARSLERPSLAMSVEEMRKAGLL